MSPPRGDTHMKIHCPHCSKSDITIDQKRSKLNAKSKFVCNACGTHFTQTEALISLKQATAILKAFDHPTRQAIMLHLMTVGEASPNMIAKEIDTGIGSVSYHMTVLRDANPPAVRRSKERPVRGAVEHFYKVVDALAE